MSARTTVTALVTGFPAGLRPPKPLPGETLLQLVIRNHPQEWVNFLERLTRDFSISGAQAKELANGHARGRFSPDVEAEIEHFLNYRLPSHGRTLTALAGIRKHLNDPEFAGALQVTLVEILWPRENHPKGQSADEQMVERLGAKMISLPTGAPREIDLTTFLPHIHGDLLWLVPGGTNMMPPLAILELERIAKFFTQYSDLAMYMDAGSSVFYRVSALQELLRRGLPLSSNTVPMGQNLRLAGCRHLYDSNPDNALCELEPEYGGPRRKLQPRPVPRSSWWKRIFGS